MWLAASANSGHGLPRKPQDKRRAVAMALAHEKSRGLSDSAIAEHCAVSHQLVGEVRALVAATSEPTKRKGEDGREVAPATEKRAASQAVRREREAESKHVESPPAQKREEKARPRAVPEERGAESLAAQAALLHDVDRHCDVARGELGQLANADGEVCRGRWRWHEVERHRGPVVHARHRKRAVGELPRVDLLP